MSRYKERVFRVRTTDSTRALTNDLTVLATAQTTSTFTMTPTRVDTATAGSATGNITADANDTTMATNIQTAIRALGGIYADATVTAGTTDTWGITVIGGYDVTWATTATSPTITESGSAGGFTATPGKTRYTGTIPVGRFIVAKRIRLQNFADASVDVSLIDDQSKNVFVTTAIDCYNSGDDPYDKFLTCDGVAGENGNAAANVSGGLFEGPIDVIVDTSAPTIDGEVILIGDIGTRGGGLKLRSTGSFSTATQDVTLGADYANVKRIKLFASADSSVAVAITDGYGRNVYTKSSSNFTTAVNEVLSHEGVDQANNAVADLLDVVVKSPALVTLTNMSTGTFTVDFWVET